MTSVTLSLGWLVGDFVLAVLVGVIFALADDTIDTWVERAVDGSTIAG